MNKITKIGVLGLSLLTLTTALFTQAQEVSKKVTLTLNAGDNSCTLQDYAFGEKTVGNAAQNLTAISHPLNCEFLKNPAATVNIQLTELANGSIGSISNANFRFAVAGATATGGITNLTATGNTFASGRVIYTKTLNKVGYWNTTLSISGTIPQFTPAGTYTGTLKVQVQAN